LGKKRGEKKGEREKRKKKGLVQALGRHNSCCFIMWKIKKRPPRRAKTCIYKE